MFSWRKKTDQELQAFLKTQEHGPLSYKEVKATQASLPPGFTHDHLRCVIGQGQVAFHRAKDALLRFRMYPAGWTSVHGPWPRYEVGAHFVMQASHLGFWSSNFCRILYLVDETSDTIERFGFAFGTLPEHAECGEERFLVEWDKASDQVFFEILAFSRPRHFLARLGSFFARFLQRRFQREAQASMKAEASAQERQMHLPSSNPP